MSQGRAKQRREESIKNIFDLSQIFRILKLVWKFSKKLTLIRIFLIFLQSILPFIPLYLMKLILDAFAAPTRPDSGYFVMIIILFLVVKIISMIVSNVMSYVLLLQSDIINDEMSKLVISKAMKTDLEYFDSDIYHDIFQRALAQSSGRPLQILSTALSFIQNAVVLITILGLLITVHWALFFVLIIIAAPVAIVRWIYTGKYIDLVESQTQEERKSGYFKGVMTGAVFAKEVRMFDFGKELLPVFLGIRKIIRGEKRRFYVRQNISISLAQLVEVAGIIAGLAYIIMQAVDGQLSVGDIALYYGVLQKGQSAVGGFLRSFVSIQENKLFVSHLFRFIDLKTKIPRHHSELDAPKNLGLLEVSDLRFTYPGTKKEIIKGISFAARPGEILAIVGENGSGKTTLLKLLTRLYESDGGAIKINGKSIKYYDIDSLRKKYSIIFQQFSKYNATVKENIYYADILDRDNIDKIVESSDLALASKFINNLPSDFDTQLGRSFKAGEELSGGQWQKIALSRAFFKDADILILDEPTSFIDPIAEEKIFKNLLEVTKLKNKILILITHRVYNLKKADAILVMDQGKIVESGSHNQLMSQDGLYKRMFESQS